MAPEMILTTTEAAALLNVNPETIRRYADKGALKSERFPKSRSRRRIWAHDLIEFAEHAGLTLDWSKLPA